MSDSSTGGSAPVQPAGPGPVRRMTFEYDGDQIKLVSEQHVQLIVPPSQPLEQQPHEVSGFSVLLRDQREQPVYRFTRTSPIQHDAEVFNPPGADDSITRVPVEKPQGTFVVLVPNVPGAKTLELVGHPPRPNTFSAQPERLARFELKPFEGE